MQPKTVLIYQDENGHEPYTEWFKNLRDARIKARIEARLRRLATGHYGDFKSVGEGVLELRLFFGPGYRVYFGEEAGEIVILLIGGDKNSQDKDIKKAKDLWKDHKENG